MKHILPTILAFCLLGASSMANAKTFTYVETYTPANLYTEASSSNLNKLAVISDTDNTIYRLDSGQSLKIKLVIPPGVDVFTASVQVSKWKTASSTGEFLYAKSMTDLANVEDYNATFSTSFPFQFVNTAFSDSDVPISVVSNDTTTSQKTGYMIFDNTTTDDALLLKTLSIQFTVNSSKLSTYNAWVSSTGSSLPITLNVNGGGTGTSTDGTSSGSNGSTIDFSETPDENTPCSPLLGNCGTSTGSTSTDTPTDTTSTDTPTDTTSTDTPTDTTSTDTPTDTTSTDTPTDTSTDTTPTETTSTGSTTTDGVSTGTYKTISKTTSDSYYLWDSVADDTLLTEDNGTRHIRVRIETDKFSEISTELVDLDNGNLTPTAIIKREPITVTTNNGGLTLYPYPEDPDGLLDTIIGLFPNDTAGITRKGIVYVIIDGNILFGYLDYYVTKPDTEQSGGAFSFGAIENENGLQVMKITYPSGVIQKMYFYSTPLPTIDN